MGGAVSSGRDNNELIDNLMSGNYIRTRRVEKVFRALDRADYMTPEARDQAYKDLAWRNGPLHLSSPCIYSEVMEGLELRPGLSFLNIGSGTGYLSTLAGLILGTAGISHGVEVHPAVVEYAVKKIGQFIENSPTLDDFDFCEPKFYQGNGLCLAALSAGYDRVYCGAGCPDEYESYFKQLIKVGGVLVMPLNDTLLQVRRVAADKWVTRSLLNVSFATLRVPAREEAGALVRLDEQSPSRLQLLSRAAVRAAMRRGVLRRHPELREAPRRPPPAACPRRICIPIEPGGAVEGLNVLHDLDSENGANEMNALLSLVISMGRNRVAGALRFDRVDSDSDSSEEEPEDRPRDPDDENPQNEPPPEESRSENGSETENKDDSSPKLDATTTDSDNDAPEPTVQRRGSKRPESNHRSDNNHRPDNNHKSDNHKTDNNHKPNGYRLGRRQRPRDDDSDDPKISPRCRELLLKKNDRDAEKPSTSNVAETRTDDEKASCSSERNSSESADDQPRNGQDSDPSNHKAPGVPSEVEIYIGKTQSEAGTSFSEMEWEESKTDTLEGSDEETEPVAKSRAKRQKLDSGIEEATPSGSSPDKSKSGGSDSERSDCPSDDADPSPPSRRRTRWSLSDEEAHAAHAARRRRRVARGGDARRVRLSLLMKQAVRELPLPHALKKFVNLGRCFEF